MLGLALVVLSVRHGKAEPIVAVVRLLGIAASTSVRTEAGGTSLGTSLLSESFAQFCSILNMTFFWQTSRLCLYRNKPNSA